MFGRLGLGQRDRTVGHLPAGHDQPVHLRLPDRGNRRGDQRGGPRILQNRGEFRLGVGRVDRYDGEPGGEGGEERDREVQRVTQLQADPVPRTQIEAGQTGGRPLDPFGELGPGQLSVAVDQRGAAGLAFGGPEHQIGDTANHGDSVATDQSAL